MRPGARASAGRPATPDGPGRAEEPPSGHQGPDGLGPLPREFFAGPSVEVAPGLLGCVLSARSPDGEVAVRLTEVEAYLGEADPASHAYRGPTRRNAVMYGEPGHAYVYFTYGMHFCVNLVCQPPGTASAVLLRAGAVVSGAALARHRRSSGKRSEAAPRDLARGPGRLCQALGIDRALDGADVCDPGSPVRIFGPGPPGTAVSSGPRVGVSTAATVPWRFWVTGDPTVSPYRAHTPRGKPSAGL
jgi:DNA-3-methyladenine glycosylase